MPDCLCMRKGIYGLYPMAQPISSLETEKKQFIKKTRLSTRLHFTLIGPGGLDHRMADFEQIFVK